MAAFILKTSQVGIHSKYKWSKYFKQKWIFLKVHFLKQESILCCSAKLFCYKLKDPKKMVYIEENVYKTMSCYQKMYPR